MPDPARMLAVEALLAWQEGRIERLTDMLDRSEIAGRDRALARELALGTVRHQALYDHLIDHFMVRPPPPPLRLLLRLCCHQLFALDRIPVHAAVDATASLARAIGLAWAAGAANAVARRCAALRLETRDPTLEGPLGRLDPIAVPTDAATRHSLPAQLLSDLAEVRPPGDAELAWAALNRVPPLCTRSLPGRTIPQDPAILQRDGSWTWWSDPSVALRHAVATGLAVVQDRSQGELLQLANPQRGELALDCCAAPGGKSRLLCEAGCRLLAADQALGKLVSLAAELPSLPVLAQDVRSPALAAAVFDLVLLDVPCSNSGVLARRPEARWRYRPAALASLCLLQAQALAAASSLVAPSGRLLYSTCSLVPAENQLQVRALPGWRIEAERLLWPDAWQAGGYAALLRRG